MRKIKEIIIHCSATKEGRNFTVADIDRWHRERAAFPIYTYFPMQHVKLLWITIL